MSYLLEAAARTGGGPPAAAALASTPASPTGQTPLTMAVTHGSPAHLTCAAALVTAGANWLGVNGRGDTPLHAAARAGRAGALRFLLGCTVRVGARPALLAAVVVQSPSAGRVRLVDARNRAGLAPLDLAVLSGSAPAVAALLSAGADGLALLPRAGAAAARAAPGSTLLHLAAARGMMAVSGVLVDASAATRRGGSGGGGADLRSVRDAFGRLPARVAAAQGHPALARAIVPPPDAAGRGEVVPQAAAPARVAQQQPRCTPTAILEAVARRAGLLLDLALAEHDQGGGGRARDTAGLADAVAATAAALARQAGEAAASPVGVAALVRALATVAGGAAKATKPASTTTTNPTLGAAALAMAASAAIAAACPAAAPGPASATTTPATAGLANGADPGAAAAFTAAVCVTLSAAPADLLSATAVVIAGEPRREEEVRPRMGLAAWLQRAVGCGRPAEEEERGPAAPAWAVPAGAAPLLAPAPPAAAASTWASHGGAWAHALEAAEAEEEGGGGAGPFWLRRTRRAADTPPRSSAASSGDGEASPVAAATPEPSPPPPPPPALLAAQPPPPPPVCPVCMDARPNVRAAPCGHALCGGCAAELVTRGGVLGPGPVCPFCRGMIGGVVGVGAE